MNQSVNDLSGEIWLYQRLVSRFDGDVNAEWKVFVANIGVVDISFIFFCHSRNFVKLWTAAVELEAVINFF